MSEGHCTCDTDEHCARKLSLFGLGVDKTERIQGVTDLSHWNLQDALDLPPPWVSGLSLPLDDIRHVHTNMSEDLHTYKDVDQYLQQGGMVAAMIYDIHIV